MEIEQQKYYLKDSSNYVNTPKFIQNEEIEKIFLPKLLNNFYRNDTGCFLSRCVKDIVKDLNKLLKFCFLIEENILIILIMIFMEI